MRTLAQWEDTDRERQVLFSIEYSIDGPSLNLENITPMKVSFVCPQSNTVLRSVGVHGERGKNLLKNQLKASGKLEGLMNGLATKHGLVPSV